MNYEDAIKLPVSEKITLVTIESTKQVKLFSLVGGSVYSKNVDYFVANVKQGLASLLKVSSLPEIVDGSFYYDIKNKTLYVSTLGGGDPLLENISLTYKHFFSNAPIVLPFDLNDGEPIEWLPYISNVGTIGQRLDDENVGIVLESTSSIDLLNSDRYFDSIFDTLIWENQSVDFYSWISLTKISECKKIFEGIVDTKDFGESKVSFKVNDFTYKFRDELNVELFSDLDGTILDSSLGSPKRRIYGKVDKCRAIPIDVTKNGYTLAGTSSVSLDSVDLVGVGTQYIKELVGGDEVIFEVNDKEYKYTIESVTSDTLATITRGSQATATNKVIVNRPKTPYRFKNRRWHIAGHKIREASVIVQEVINSRQFKVLDVSEFYKGDLVTINGITTKISRVSGKQIVLEQSIFPTPHPLDVIKKEPITGAYFGTQRLILNRDFTLTNTSEAILEIDELAEFNISREVITGAISLKFTNGSRSVTTTGIVDLRTIIKPSDWVRSHVQNSDVWFEVSSVNETEIVLKTDYSEATNTNQARIKQVEIIDDESIIAVDCYGMDYSNKWVRTASDAVKHIIINDAKFPQVNEESFTQANSDCDYTLSMVIPEDVNGKNSNIKDTINKINNSVFGSLYGNTSQGVSFSIINSRRPYNIEPIKDDDIISWDCDSINTVVNAVNVNYSKFTDLVTGELSSKLITFLSDFVNKYIGIKAVKEVSCLLYDDLPAENMAQRHSFYNSLSKIKIKLKGKANFFSSSVNDRIYIKFDRLFKRFGTNSSGKIAIVSGVSKGQFDSEITLNDMGNIFNRNPVIAPNATDNFTLSSEDDKIKYGFVLDSNTLTPDISSEEQLGNCLIG